MINDLLSTPEKLPIETDPSDILAMIDYESSNHQTSVVADHHHHLNQPQNHQQNQQQSHYHLHQQHQQQSQEPTMSYPPVSNGYNVADYYPHSEYFYQPSNDCFELQPHQALSSFSSQPIDRVYYNPGSMSYVSQVEHVPLATGHKVNALESSSNKSSHEYLSSPPEPCQRDHHHTTTIPPIHRTTVSINSQQQPPSQASNEMTDFHDVSFKNIF